MPTIVRKYKNNLWLFASSIFGSSIGQVWASARTIPSAHRATMAQSVRANVATRCTVEHAAGRAGAAMERAISNGPHATIPILPKPSAHQRLGTDYSVGSSAQLKKVPTGEGLAFRAVARSNLRAGLM